MKPTRRERREEFTGFPGLRAAGGIENRELKGKVYSLRFTVERHKGFSTLRLFDSVTQSPKDSHIHTFKHLRIQDICLLPLVP